MSTSTSTAVSAVREALPESLHSPLTGAEMTEIHERFTSIGVPTADAEQRRATLKALDAATKDDSKTADDMLAVLREGALLVGDVESLTRVHAVAAATAKYGRDAIDASHANAVRIMRDFIVKAGGPTAPASAIKATAIGAAAQHLSPNGTKPEAFRKRWSRYANVTRAIMLSEAAVKAGTPDAQVVTARQVMSALTSTPATVEEILTLATEGKAMPVPAGKGSDPAAPKDSTPKAASWADVIRDAERLAGTIKRLPKGEAMTENQSKVIAGLFTTLRARLDVDVAAAKRRPVPAPPKGKAAPKPAETTADAIVHTSETQV